MIADAPVLQGRYVRLEPLQRHHTEALAAAAAADRSLYRWSPIPNGVTEVAAYIDAALSGRAVAFASVRVADNTVIGSTRFFDIEHWAWPKGHPRHGRTAPDACEIGYTWYARSAIRTGANTEGKLLMLTHAFEVWGALRVCFHTDMRNERSRAALARIGGQFEGVLRSHRMASDFIARDSARFSIVAADWPTAKQRLTEMLR
jgi:RimJ/RimL family protein N-acetyltransferase